MKTKVIRAYKGFQKMFDANKKLYFLFSYIYNVIKSPFEVRKGRASVVVAQAIWVLRRLGLQIPMPKIFSGEYFETIFGKFFVNPDLISIYAVSPSFERAEMEMLINMIRKESEKRKRILFIDIGAFFGLYTVAVGNKFKQNNKVDIVTFEPGSDYLSDSTLKILEKNILINNLRRAVLHKYGIGSKVEKNKYGIKTKPLDKFISLKDSKQYDVVFIKLDVDDFVEDGLKGIQKSVEKFSDVYLLVEDFVKPKKVFPYLQKHGYTLIEKPTPYNSFWKYKK